MSVRIEDLGGAIGSSYGGKGCRWWPRGEPVRLTLFRRRVRCPMAKCRGTMRATGGAWPMYRMGWHHECSACGVVFAITSLELEGLP